MKVGVNFAHFAWTKVSKMKPRVNILLKKLFSYQPSELGKYLTKIFRQFSQMRQYSVEFTTYFGLL
jgi:hypothetical protein